MDELDELENRRAAAEEFNRRDREAQETVAKAKPPVTECEDCGDPLTPLRQSYRCARCVDCQILFERTAKGYRKKS